VSVYIPNMEMPSKCSDCDFAIETYDGSGVYACIITEERLVKLHWNKRREDCPLVPIPPHGRLIDLDMLIKEINERIEAAIRWGVNAIADRNDEIKLRAEQAVATFCEASLTAKKLPTIIPADEEGEA